MGVGADAPGGKDGNAYSPIGFQMFPRLAGDLVNTIKHDDPDKGYEDWDMTSYAVQAIASGIYLFTVEDANTGKVQVGKFVVIK